MLNNVESLLFSHSSILWVSFVALKPLLLVSVALPSALIISDQTARLLSVRALLSEGHEGSFTLSVHRMVICLCASHFLAIIASCVYILWLMECDLSPHASKLVVFASNRSVWVVLETLKDGVIVGSVALLAIVWKDLWASIGLRCAGLDKKRLVIWAMIGAVGLGVIWIGTFIVTGASSDPTPKLGPYGMEYAVLGIVWTVTAGVMAEEIIYRGIVYGGLRNLIGVWPGILISAILFALAHLRSPNSTMAFMFMAGCILAFIYERAGSLYPVVCAHGANNIVSMVAGYLSVQYQ